MEAVLYNMPGDFGKRFDMHWGDLIYSASKVFSKDFDRKEHVGFRIMSFIDYDNPRAHVNTGDNEFINPRSDLDLVTLYIKSYLKEMDLESAVRCYRMDPPLVSIVALPALSRGMTLLYENDRDNLEKIHSDMQDIIDGIAKVLQKQISRIVDESKK